MSKEPSVPNCVFNRGVDCANASTKRCSTCGWNPVVAKYRKAIIHMKRVSETN